MEALEFEEALKRIQRHHGVKGAIVINNDGSLIKSTFDSTSFDSTSSAVDYAKNAKTVCDHAKTVVRDLDPSNELMFLRIGTKKKEIIMTPDKDFLIMVIQDTTDVQSS